MSRFQQRQNTFVSWFLNRVVCIFCCTRSIFWIIFTSFKSVKKYSILTIWFGNCLDNYIAVIKGLPEFPIYFSIRSATLGTLLLVLPLSATPVALGSLISGWSCLFIIAILAIPYLVFLIPLYIVEDILNLLDTNLGLILPYAALNLPLGILIMQASYKEIPSELEDSARIDGANPFQTWLMVLTPLVITGLAAVTIFTFVAVWEEYMFARTFMLSTSAQTLSVGLPSLRVESKSWAYGTLSAALTVSLLPISVVFVVLRKYFIEGVMRGSIKG